MGKTVIGPIAARFPAIATPAIVQLKRKWSDDWTSVPELEFLGATASTAAHGLGAATLLHRYGVLKNPWQPSDAKQATLSLAGCWVRVMFAGQQGMQQAWIGRIVGENRTIFGPRQSAYGSIPAGAQCFDALAPLDILRKIDVSRSYWQVADTATENDYKTVMIQWVTPLNEKYGRADKPAATKGKALGSGPGAKALGSRSGNRSPLPNDDGVYIHAGYTPELWDYLQYAKYLLEKFVDESHSGGPAWTIGGQCEILSSFSDPIEWGVTQNVEQMLRRLIRPDLGLDYQIVATDNGFEVSVFVLTRDSCGWGGQTLPGNPNTVKIIAGRTKDSIRTSVEKTAAQRYGTIRLLGSRIVVCSSLHSGVTLPTGKPFPGKPLMESLVGCWSKGLEKLYIAGTGNPADDPALQDVARQQEQFHQVYAMFVGSNDWAFGATPTPPQAPTPQWDGQGNPLDSQEEMVTLARPTLPWLPLEHGVAYCLQPPLDQNDAGVTPSLRQPQVWLYDVDGDKWVPADKAHVGLSVLHDRIGFFLHAHPQYLLASSEFSGEGESIPLWDYELMIATLAYFTDQRIYCEQAIADAKPSDGVLEIDASDCQLWWLAGNTILDVDEQGQAILSPKEGTLVRNDWQRMAARMAGALARYYQERARAQITVHGLLPWGGLLGQILTVIDEGGDTQTIEAPITDVRWTNGDNPSTIVSTGFARE